LSKGWDLHDTVFKDADSITFHETTVSSTHLLMSQGSDRGHLEISGIDGLAMFEPPDWRRADITLLRLYMSLRSLMLDTGP
jgi:hypothetical protein